MDCIKEPLVASYFASCLPSHVTPIANKAERSTELSCSHPEKAQEEGGGTVRAAWEPPNKATCLEPESAFVLSVSNV